MSEPAPESRKCAICGKPQNPAIRPFCSTRCANLDLSRWLKGDYAIPGGPADPDGDLGGDLGGDSGGEQGR